MHSYHIVKQSNRTRNFSGDFIFHPRGRSCKILHVLGRSSWMYESRFLSVTFESAVVLNIFYL